MKLSECNKGIYRIKHENNSHKEHVLAFKNYAGVAYFITGSGKLLNVEAQDRWDAVPAEITEFTVTEVKTVRVGLRRI